jgi:hypothetical protein
VHRRGIPLGGKYTTGDWKVYLGPLLHELDPKRRERRPQPLPMTLPSTQKIKVLYRNSFECVNVGR